MNSFFAFLILLTFCLILAIPYAIIGGLIGYKNWLDKPFGIVFISAAYTVVLVCFPTVIPINHAHCLYQFPIFLQVLDLGGVPAILFVVVFVNWQIVKAIVSFKSSSNTSIYALLRGAALLAIICLYGAFQIDQIERSTKEQGHSLKVGMIQPYLLREDSLDRLYSMSLKLVRDNPEIDLLVWPEFPTAFSYVENAQDKYKINRLIKLIKKPILLVSGYIYETPPVPTKKEPHYYNTAQLIDENAVLQDSYAKQILVPFFEYLPAEERYPFLRDFFPGALFYIPGEEFTLFDLNADTHIIPLICYETVFPKMTQTFVELGGNIIINLTNDVWFGDSRGSASHFAVGLFRSIEHRVPWIRATNSGVSGVAKATGEIIDGSTTPLFETATRVFEVGIPPERSIYSRYGDVFLYGLVLVLLFGLFKDKFWRVLGQSRADRKT